MYFILSLRSLNLIRPGWDMHFDIEVPLSNQFDEISLGLSTFREAMIAQQKWEDVTVVLVSEFARTLMGNTGNGRYVFFKGSNGCRS